MSADRVFIGVDPGKQGGMVALFAEEISPTAHRSAWTWLIKDIQFKTMPESNREIFHWFEEIVGENMSVMCCLEQVGGYTGEKEGTDNPAPGSAMFNFGRNYGALEMAIESQLREGETFFRVRPQAWQKELDIIPRRKPTKKRPEIKEETDAQWKARLKEIAFRIFPTCHFTNATADAALIAHYCYLMHG